MSCTKLLIIVAVATVASPNAFADDTTRKDDQTAIKAVIDKRTEGFNQKDAAAQAALYTDDSDFYASNGTVSVVGSEKIESLLELVHRGPLKNASLKQEVTKISFLSPEVALVTVSLTMKRPEKDGGTYRNRGLRVMVKRDGVWKIRTFMNQRVVESTVTQEDADKARSGKRK